MPPIAPDEMSEDVAMASAILAALKADAGQLKAFQIVLNKHGCAIVMSRDTFWVGSACQNCQALA